jgi:hypothetical protein
LYAVADAFTSPVVFLEPYGLFVETQRLEHGLTTVPGKKDIGCLLKLDVVANVLLQQFVAHAAFLSFRKVLFLQVITVLAAQVTQRACRFCHYV